MATVCHTVREMFTLATVSNESHLSPTLLLYLDYDSNDNSWSKSAQRSRDTVVVDYKAQILQFGRERKRNQAHLFPDLSHQPKPHQVTRTRILRTQRVDLSNAARLSQGSGLTMSPDSIELRNE
ncbi:hypothetical protein HYALB_00013858 [Hymenoscyphus albidus]|uniref:Uncharacterized protein n=1 Tax=Hymenoscyphus albidus TaxID=595503 RepID=A0A9N9LWK9_9HELO|nr:hypothetical protein HYALB_00013411 [Hymenoscyphus albidus]CAG8981198.1 hypothetical protein HYALB_00013858 [Hymenoscyphus albidus]